MADASWLDEAPEAPESFLDNAPEVPEEKPGILRSFASGITKFPFSQYLATAPSARRMGGLNAPEATTPGNAEQRAQHDLLIRDWAKSRAAHPDAFNSGSGFATGMFTLPLTALMAPAATSSAPLQARALDASGRAALMSAIAANGLSEKPDFWGRVLDTVIGGGVGAATGWLAPASHPRGEVIAQASRPSGMAERAGIQAVQAHGARETDVANLQHKYGGQGKVGDEAFAGLKALEMKTPEGKPVLPFFGGHKRIASRYDQVREASGRGLGAIKSAVDEKNPNAVDADVVLTRAENEVLPRFDNREMRAGHGPGVADQLKTTLKNIEAEFAPPAEVARNIEYPTPEQAQMSLIPEGRIVPGPTATMNEPPPVQVATEVSFQNPLPGMYAQGPGRTMPGPQPHPQPPTAQATLPGVGSLEPQTVTVPNTNLNRTPVLPGFEQLPAETVPGNPVMRDVSATGNTQGLAIQPELRGTQDWRVADAGPVTRRFGTQSLTSAEKVKEILGDRSRMTKSTKYPDRNPEAIAADPDLAAIDAVRAQYRAEGERAVDRELGPSVLSEFLRLKGQHGFAKQMGKIAHNEYNGDIGSGGKLPVSRHDIARLVLGPTHAPRARIYYGLSQAGNAIDATQPYARQSTLQGSYPTLLDFINGVVE